MTSIPTINSVLAQSSARVEEEFVNELRYLPSGWWALACLALLVLLCWTVLWMYRREGRVGASARVRWVLGLLRCVVILALAVILLEPVRVRILRRWLDSYVLVLVDDSSSMDLTDSYREEPDAARLRELMGRESVLPARRSDLVEQLLTFRDRAFLHELAANNRVKLYTFNSEPTLRATVASAQERREGHGTPGAAAEKLTGVNEIPLDFAGTGATTNIERALRRTVESLGSAPLAGVVVLSDGGFNDGAPAEEVARFAREHRLAVHAVGIGDPAPPRNVRVSELHAPDNVFQKDPFAISARFTSQGAVGDTIRVNVRERSETDGGEGQVVETRSLPVGPTGVIEPLTIERRQERIGRFTYSVELPVLESESVADDNSKQVTVNVFDSRLKVLVIAGGPSWDYRYVTRLLQRDDTVDVSCWLQSADINAVRDGDRIIDHLPRLPEELFTYDVVILMDADGKELDKPWAELIDQFVTDHGGGLLVTAARAHTPALLREADLKPLHDLLPVTLDPEADLVQNRIGHYQLEGASLDIPPTAFGHPILQLADDPASTKLKWQGIGDIHWHYPVLREKPVATVLLRHGDPRMRNAHGGHVLLAVQFVGAGRTGFLAFDGTWRWRRHGEELFNRFWVQLVRHLAEGKLLGGTRRCLLLTDADQFSLGEAVTVTARLLDERFEPLRLSELTAVRQVEGEQKEFTLTAQRDRPGWFEGRFIPDRIGAYRISMRLPGATGGDVGEVSREVRVSRPNIEVLRPQMDRAELTTLAERSAGGRYFEINEMFRLPAIIPDLHEEIPVRSRPVTLWDNWVTLLVLVFLLSTEWFVRKWNRLL